jgi:hypothetical protein
MRKEPRTSLPPATMSTPMIQVGVHVSQSRSQPGLVIHPIPISQNLGW